MKEARQRQELTPEQKAWVAENVTLRGYYDHFLAPEKRLKKSSGKLSNGTLQKDRQALNRWETYTRPDDWPTEAGAWEGLVLGAIDEEDLEGFVERARYSLAGATVKTTWYHLRTIINHAWRTGVLGRHLAPEAIESDDGEPPIYSDEEIERAYHAFDDRVDLQVAWVIGISCAPRTEDVFCLKWDGVRLAERNGPTLVYTARKTGKTQGVPLSDLVARHIQRLPRRGPYLFPGLSEPTNKDPGKSRTARERNAEIKRRLAAAGVATRRKPFQAARATCNDRLESHQEGVGQFVLGHALTLNSKSYRSPTGLVRRAIETLLPPPCFTRFESPREFTRQFGWSA